MMTRTPAEVFPPGQFLQEELDARGWTTADLAQRMGGDPAVDQLAVDIMLGCEPEDKGILLGREMAEGLALALGTSTEYWENLDRAWRDHPCALEG